jgi:hypothetical protein
MPKSDRVRLQHMLDAAREALSFVREKTREDLDQDRLLVLVGESHRNQKPPIRSLPKLVRRYRRFRGRISLGCDTDWCMRTLTSIWTFFGAL